MNGPLFQICDLVIESNLVFPEVPQVVGLRANCRFEIFPSGASLVGDFRWFHHRRLTDSDKEPWLSSAHCGRDYLLRFPSQGDFLIARDSSLVKCHPLADTPESTVRHLFLDQVVPLILSRRERLVLHASSVLTRGGVVAFAGLSGQGKSTLAASFGLSGFPLLSDDCLVLRDAPDGWVALPGYPGVRLWPDTAARVFNTPPESAEVAHYTTKRRVDDPALVPFAGTPSSVKCLYFLDPESNGVQSDMSIVPLSQQEAFMKLVNFAYNLDITDRDFLENQFSTIGRLTAQLACYRLRYPRGFSMLPTIRRAILSHREFEPQLQGTTA